MSAAKWRPCCLGLNVLIYMIILKRTRMLSVQFVALHKPRKPKLNTLRPRQNGRHFADDIFKCIFLNENVWIPIKISVKFVPKGPINNIPALVQIMAWRRPGDKPLSESMMVSLPTHICVTRPHELTAMDTFSQNGKLHGNSNRQYVTFSEPSPLITDQRGLSWATRHGTDTSSQTLTWWRHQMEIFSALRAVCAGNSPVPGEFPLKGQWRGALMFSLIWVWIIGWVNNRETQSRPLWRHCNGLRQNVPSSYTDHIFKINFIDGLWLKFHWNCVVKAQINKIYIFFRIQT